MRWRALLLLLSLAGAAAAAAPSPGEDGIEFSTIAYVATGVAAAQQSLAQPGPGAGVKLAIMDSGVNWRHPVFGNSRGLACSAIGAAGCRVAAGHDFVGDRADGGYAPDGDPEDCADESLTHGTEVASVATGDASFLREQPWRGVAYRASLLAYKVAGACGASAGAVNTSATLDAIRAATQAGADVLALAYGDFRAGAYVDGRYAAALVAAMQQGAAVAIAAGNDGYAGPWLTEGAVAAPGVISAAAAVVIGNLSGVQLGFSERLQLPGGGAATSMLRSEETSMLPGMPQQAAQQVTAQQQRVAGMLPLRVVPVQPLQACGALSNAQQLRGQIALVARGECIFVAKAAAAAAAGAVGVIVFNHNKSEEFAGMAWDAKPAVPIWALQYGAGKALLAAAQRAQPLRLTSLAPVRMPALKVDVQPAAFSSWGPAATLELLPTLTAPGSSIQAATAGANFTQVDGTSFSAPFVAGALALYRQTRPASRVVAAMQQQQQQQHQHQHQQQQQQQQSSLPPARPASWWGATWEAVRSRVFVTGLFKPSADGAERAASSDRQANSASRSKLQAGVGMQGPDAAAASSASVPAVAGGSSVGAAAPQGSRGDAAVAAAGYAQQAAAYASFVSTAKPIDWQGKHGWAQPVSRVGAGLIQVAAAIHNPTTLKPNHLLLRSNQPAQAASFTAHNAAAFAITYKLDHRPAAAVNMQDAWFVDEPEQLLRARAAAVSFRVGGKAVQQLTLQPGGSATVQVLFSLPPELRACACLFSGYITLTPVGPAPAKPSKAQAAMLAGTGPAPARSSAGTVSVPFAPTPLVVPFQGFSQNYSTAPLLAAPDPARFPARSKALAASLRVCFAEYARDSDEPAKLVEAAGAPSNQDGSLHQPHVDACLQGAASEAAVTRLPLDRLAEGQGVVVVVAAMLRPALRMSLMLFDAAACAHGSQANCSAAAAPTDRRGGKLVGEVWRYRGPSRDYPGRLFAYTSDFFDGWVAQRDAHDKVTGWTEVQRRPARYRMQLWIQAPLAAADRDYSGETYITHKHDIPGVVEFV